MAPFSKRKSQDLRHRLAAEAIQNIVDNSISGSRSRVMKKRRHTRTIIPPHRVGQKPICGDTAVAGHNNVSHESTEPNPLFTEPSQQSSACEGYLPSCDLKFDALGYSAASDSAAANEISNGDEGISDLFAIPLIRTLEGTNQESRSIVSPSQDTSSLPSKSQTEGLQEQNALSSVSESPLPSTIVVGAGTTSESRIHQSMPIKTCHRDSSSFANSESRNGDNGTSASAANGPALATTPNAPLPSSFSSSSTSTDESSNSSVGYPDYRFFPPAPPRLRHERIAEEKAPRADFIRMIRLFYGENWSFLRWRAKLIGFGDASNADGSAAFVEVDQEAAVDENPTNTHRVSFCDMVKEFFRRLCEDDDDV